MNRRAHYLLLILAVLLCPHPSPAASWSCPYCGLNIQTDPRDPGYQQRLSQIHLNSCPKRPGTSQGSGGSGATPTYSGPSAWEIEQQRQAEEERQRKQREAEEAYRAREATDRKFQADKQQALGELKGGGIPAPSELKTSTNFFGLKGSSTALEIKTGMSQPDLPTAHLAAGSATASTGWRQADAALYLSMKAAKATNSAEASYLAAQAFEAMHGGKVGVQLPERWRIRESTPESVRKVYALLIRSTTDEIVRMNAAEQRANELLKRRQEAREKSEAARVRLAEVQPSVAPPKPDAPEAGSLPAMGKDDAFKGKDPTGSQNNDDGGLAEAQAALKAALAAEAETDAELQAANEEMTKARDTLERNSAMTDKLEANPALADEYLKQLQPPGALPTDKPRN